MSSVDKKTSDKSLEAFQAAVRAKRLAADDSELSRVCRVGGCAELSASPLGFCFQHLERYKKRRELLEAIRTEEEGDISAAEHAS